MLETGSRRAASDASYVEVLPYGIVGLARASEPRFVFGQQRFNAQMFLRRAARQQSCCPAHAHHHERARRGERLSLGPTPPRLPTHTAVAVYSTQSHVSPPPRGALVVLLPESVRPLSLFFYILTSRVLKRSTTADASRFS